MIPEASVEASVSKNKHPYSVAVISINLLIAAALVVFAINDYRQYLYIERLLNNPSMRLSPLALMRAFALPVLTIALWVTGAMLEIKQSRLATVYNIILPVTTAAGIIFQFYFQFTSQIFLETQAMIAISGIPLLLVAFLYLVIYTTGHKRAKVPRSQGGAT